MIRDSEKSRKNWEKANEVIFEVITEKRPFTELSKFALQAGNLHAKIMATEANMETNRLVVGKMIYSKAGRRRRVRAAHAADRSGGDAEALAAYIGDRAMLRAHGLAARRRAEDRFGIDTMVRRYQDLYDGLLAGS